MPKTIYPDTRNDHLRWLTTGIPKNAPPHPESFPALTGNPSAGVTSCDGLFARCGCAGQPEVEVRRLFDHSLLRGIAGVSEKKAPLRSASVAPRAGSASARRLPTAHSATCWLAGRRLRRKPRELPQSAGSNLIRSAERALLAA